MTRAMLGLCFTLLLFTAASATALEPEKGPDYARNGVYVGVAGTYAFETFRDTGPISFDDSLGLNARLGYRLHPRFATELEFEWLEGFDVKGAGVEVETWALTANGKGFLMTGPVQPFLLVGVGIMRPEFQIPGFGNPDDVGFAARFGAGVDLYATEHCVVSVGADYVTTTADIGGINFDNVAVQWGLQYRF